MAKRRPEAARWGRRIVLLLAAVSFGVLGVWSVLDVLDATDALRDAERRIDAADLAIREARVGDAQRALDQAEQLLHEANEELRFSPGLVLLRPVPVFSQNLESLDRTIELAGVVVHGGRRILATTDRLQDEAGELAVDLSDGAVPAGAVDRATTEIRALLVALIGQPEPSSGLFVLPQIRSAAHSVQDEAGIQEENLLRLRRGLVILDQIVGIDQPRRTLLAVANTAEMRGAGGMMLNYGVLEAEEGAVEIDEFGRVDELPVNAPPDPDELEIPEDFQQRWSGFDFTRDWRNATLSGDFTVDAPTLLAMYRSAARLRADSVVQVDAHALAAILSETGPVQVDDLGTVTADNVVDLVLNEAYVLFPDRGTRTDVLGDVAEETFRALVSGSYPSVADLATALGDAVDGRHLMMYSADPDVQASLDYFDATGALPDPENGDYMHLAVQNMSGNKLDYYLNTALDVRGRRVPGELGEVTVTVTVTNDAPVGEAEPRYIFGPFSEDHVAGVYRGAVSLYLPTGTSLVGASGDAFRHDPAMETEARRPVVSYWIDLPAGESHTAELQLRLAPPPGDGTYSMELVPSPRVRPTVASVDVDLGDGRRLTGDVELDVGWRLGPDGPESLSGF